MEKCIICKEEIIDQNSAENMCMYCYIHTLKDYEFFQLKKEYIEQDQSVTTEVLKKFIQFASEKECVEIYKLLSNGRYENAIINCLDDNDIELENYLGGK